MPNGAAALTGDRLALRAGMRGRDLAYLVHRDPPRASHLRAAKTPPVHGPAAGQQDDPGGGRSALLVKPGRAVPHLLVNVPDHFGRIRFILEHPESDSICESARLV